jgi:hypothetical protein
MRHSFRLHLCAAASALFLAACGGGIDDIVIEPEIPAVSRIDQVASNARGMESIVFRGGSAYVSLANSATEGSAVLKATLPLAANSSWTPVALGSCGVGPVGDFIVRAPKLKLLGDTIWLMQPWFDGASTEEHATCSMTAQATGFAPRDQGLRACNEYFCSTLSMTDLKAVGTRLYSNAGAGINLLGSGDNGASWKVLRGQFDSMMCTHTAFHVIGDRVLVGGECPLDFAFLEAYQLGADGLSLASQAKLPLTVPELENRNIQFIESLPDSQRVFVGVEGGLLRSQDGGKTFAFVIREPVEGNKAYPYIKSILPLNGKPDTIVVGGFDKHNHKPYLAVSRDGGATWSELSNLLPGFNPPAGSDSAAMVTSLAQDPQGRIYVSLNEREDGQGRLLQLTLGRR